MHISLCSFDFENAVLLKHPCYRPLPYALANQPTFCLDAHLSDVAVDWNGYAGWIRHHKHTLKVLPFLLALLIITMQIGSEEIIFRAVLTNVFIQYGTTFTFISSTILFVFMQTLPCWMHLATGD